jgi:putative transposase
MKGGVASQDSRKCGLIFGRVVDDKRVMARALRVLVPGAWYHVVNRGIERRLIFHGEAYYRRFEELLGLMVQQFGVPIHSYVLMPNHYHLQLETPRGNLSEAIHWLNVSYAVWLNRKKGRVGPLFQGRFKAMLHDPDENGFKIQEYIHLNPVRVKRFGSSRSDGSKEPSTQQIEGMLKELKEYRWSSFCAYAGLVAQPSWLHIEETLGELPGRTLSTKQDRYREHFAEMIGAGDFGTGWKETLATELALGSEGFVRRVRRLVKGDRTEQKALRQLESVPVSWPGITEAVARVWREPWETVSQRHGDPAREVAMLIGRRYGGMSLRQIGEAIGELSYPAVSDAVRRTTVRLAKDRSLRKRLKQVLHYLNL